MSDSVRKTAPKLLEHAVLAADRSAGKSPSLSGQASVKRLRAFAAAIEPAKEFAIARRLAMNVDVDFDTGQNERPLHDQGHVMAALGVLDRAGFIDRGSNAVWLQKVGVSAPQAMKRSQVADEARGMEET